MKFHSTDPATGRSLRAWNPHSEAQVDQALDRAAAAFEAWRDAGLHERGAALRRLGERLRDQAPALAETMALEMGKPLAEGIAEARKCALACDHVAEHAASWLADRPEPTDARRSFVTHEPLGPVLAVMPWNFPLWQVIRFGASALMAGNGVVLKHAPTTQGCAEALVALIRDAGLPNGLVPNLRVEVDRVASLIADPRVAAVTFTGSTRAGAAVAAAAGASLKRSVLELGGSDPFVVLAGADLDRAAAQGAASRLQNAGQSCVAAKRFVVERSVAEGFVARLRDRMAEVVVGDPRAAGVGMGPLAREDLRDALHRQVVGSIRAGARLELGGVLPEGPGWFYPPTLLTGVGPGQQVWDEETFGPVAAVRVVGDAEAAFEAANDTVYGLGASVWAAPDADPVALARRFRAGCVFVNGMVRSDPRLPFGGVKRSGWGRELGREGILEFVNAKTVWSA